MRLRGDGFVRHVQAYLQSGSLLHGFPDVNLEGISNIRIRVVVLLRCVFNSPPFLFCICFLSFLLQQSQALV